MMRSRRSLLNTLLTPSLGENLFRIVVIPGSLIAAVGLLWAIVRNIPGNVGLFLW